MNLKKIITNYKNYKKSYRIKNKLKNIFHKNYSFNIHVVLASIIPALFSFFAPMALIPFLGIENGIINAALCITSVLSLFFLYFTYEAKNLNKKCSNINPFLKKLYQPYSIIFVKQSKINRMSTFFNKYTTEETLEDLEDLNDAKFELIKVNSNKFIEENKDKLRYKSYNIFSHANLETAAFLNSHNKEFSFLEIIIHSLEKMPINDLKSITKEEMDIVFNDFTIEDNIIFSDIVKNRLLEVNNKEKHFVNNLKEIENLKNTNIKSKSTIFINKNVLITKI
jgi:hypothetical protein